MPKKFDTNPLDPDFPEKAKAKSETASVGGYTAPSRTPFATAEFPTEPGSVTEDTTRRFSEEQFNAYQFHGAPSPAVYETRDFSGMNKASERKVAKTGVPEKWLIGLPYLPFTIGLIAGLIQLLVIPKEETKVRFHAAQGLAAHVGILIVTTILGIVANATDLARLGSFVFTIVTTIMLIVFAIKAWQGKPVHIEPVDDLTNWLEEKIGPLNNFRS
jgi:uncharacterized membrane protein